MTPLSPLHGEGPFGSVLRSDDNALASKTRAAKTSVRAKQERDLISVVKDAVLMAKIAEQNKQESREESVLIVFSCANAKSFTFYINTQSMPCDVLYVRDPCLNHWYQSGVDDCSNVYALSKTLKRTTESYRSVYCLGSSMGGYASLLFGALLRARRVIALAPQVVLDPTFPRSPHQNTPLHYADIRAIVKEASTTEFFIGFGDLDLVDSYNISLLQDGGRFPEHISVVSYLAFDHLFPKALQKACPLDQYFSQVFTGITPETHGLPFQAGIALSPAQIEGIQAAVPLYFKKNYAAAFAILKPLTDRHPDWWAAKHLCGMAGIHGDIEPELSRRFVIEAADQNPRAFEFAHDAALAEIRAGNAEGARRHIERVNSMRKGHSVALGLLEKYSSAFQSPMAFDKDKL
ncbi:MAG: hypothetical protein WAS73_15335 [Defluviicoccus sp.]